jgi:putative transposase
VTDRGPGRIVASLGAGQPLNVGVQQAVEHPQAGPHREREEALAGGAGQLGNGDGDPFGQDQLGVTADGTKVPLGVVEGTTENTAVCTRLVTGLRDRGLDAERGVLFVLDGGKALAAAVRGVFGANALVQRCRRHKERNVTDHLPGAERPLIQRRLRAAWAIPDLEQARAELDALARGLARKRPGAAASLREGLAETLTVNRLGVGGKLLQTVESTNPVESMIEIVRDHAGRVKRWSSG